MTTEYFLQIFDAGDYFQIVCEENDNGRHWNVITTRQLDVDDSNGY